MGGFAIADPDGSAWTLAFGGIEPQPADETTCTCAALLLRILRPTLRSPGDYPRLLIFATQRITTSHESAPRL